MADFADWSNEPATRTPHVAPDQVSKIYAHREKKAAHLRHTIMVLITVLAGVSAIWYALGL